MESALEEKDTEGPSACPHDGQVQRVTVHIIGDRYRRHTLHVQDSAFLCAIQAENAVPHYTDARDTFEVSMRDLARSVNAAERIRQATAETGAQRVGDGQQPNHGEVPGTQRSASVGGDERGARTPPVADEASVGPAPPEPPAALSLRGALTQSLQTDCELFLALSKELYEISRDPLSGEGTGEVWVPRGYCAGFHVCCDVFREAYDAHVRPVVASLPPFTQIKLSDLLRFRSTVLGVFKLPPDDPVLTGRSESNLETNWVNVHVKNDKYFFPGDAIVQRTSAAGRTSPSAAPAAPASLPSRFIDVTLSHVPRWVSRREPALDKRDTAGMSSVNELQTFYLTQLLRNPSWEPDDASTQCPACGRAFTSLLRPLGTRAHHCRACGRRLCALCTSKKAHRSFAKLSKPSGGSSGGGEPDERVVCDSCYVQYLDLEKLRYLGALFAFAGLDFVGLSLCRTVNQQWRHAAELCISEYRLLTHSCNPDLRSVLTPVGVFLQNSTHLILSASRPDSAKEKKHKSSTSAKHKDAAPDRPSTLRVEPGGAVEGTADSDGAMPPLPCGDVLTSLHPEPALLLLKHIQDSSQWNTEAARYFVELLSQSAPHMFVSNGAPPVGRTHPKRRFTHWHFYCTSFCGQMPPTYFATDAMERLAAAPADCAYASRAVNRLAVSFLSPAVLLARGPRPGQPAQCPKGKRRALQGPTSQTAGSLTATSAPLSADAETVALWLMGLLLSDASWGPTTFASPSLVEVLKEQRRYQELLESALPPLVAASVPFALFVLCALQSTNPLCGYDEELLGLWRTRVWEEVGRATDGHHRRATLEATLDFFTALDTFCALPSTALGGSELLVRWIRQYCLVPVGPAGLWPLPFDRQAAGPFTHSLASTGERASAVASDMYSAAATGTPSTAPAERAVFADLPHPIFYPFNPGVVLKSVLASGVHVETTSSSRPVWLTFSTFNAAEREAAATRSADDAARSDGKDASATAGEVCQAQGGTRARGQQTTSSRDEPSSAEQQFHLLYKRENAERDMLMCVSSRLLQQFLQERVGGATLANYSVLPLSYNSAMIEKAEGYVLSKLPGAGSPATITSYLSLRGEDAQRNFLASARLFLLLNYIFSIGDRHQGNVMLNPAGAIFHIDFGFVLSEKTLVEKIAGTTMRVDNQFLSAVVACRRNLRERRSTQSSQPQLPHGSDLRSHVTSAEPAETSAASSPFPSPVVPSLMTEYAEFFAEAAEWFITVRPYASVFYRLWLYAVHSRTLNGFTPADMASVFNRLFDRSASRESSAENFAATMRQSINVCRLKDVTHSGALALRSYAEQVTRRVTEGGSEAKRLLGSMWNPRGSFF